MPKAKDTMLEAKDIVAVRPLTQSEKHELAKEAARQFYAEWSAQESEGEEESGEAGSSG